MFFTPPASSVFHLNVVFQGCSFRLTCRVFFATIFSPELRCEVVKLRLLSGPPGMCVLFQHRAPYPYVNRPLLDTLPTFPYFLCFIILSLHAWPPKYSFFPWIPSGQSCSPPPPPLPPPLTSSPVAAALYCLTSPSLSLEIALFDELTLVRGEFCSSRVPSVIAPEL